MKQCLIIVLLSLASTMVQANHIVGGEIFYSCIKKDEADRRTTFKIDLNLYAEIIQNGGNFNTVQDIGIYRIEDGDWVWVKTLNSRIKNQTALQPTFTDPCVVLTGPNNLQRASYEYEITLDWGFEYWFVYHGCCRSVNISNIAQSGSTGAIFYATITELGVETCSNSPKFNNAPPPVLCLGRQLTYDQNAVDADEEDEVVHTFCAPYTTNTIGFNMDNCTGLPANYERCKPPYPRVVYYPPFYDQNPMVADPIVTIHPKTGLISGGPEIRGLYLITICARDYRNGKLLGEVRRDYQFTVIQCGRLYEALAVAKDSGPKKLSVTNAIEKDTLVIKSCGAFSLQFDNTSVLRGNAMINYDWVFKGNSNLTSIVKSPRFDFTNKGLQYGRLILKPSPSGCGDTLDIKLIISDSLRADFDITYDSCKTGPVKFDNKTFAPGGKLAEVKWKFSDGGASTEESPSYSYLRSGQSAATMIVVDANGCSDTLVKAFRYQPVPVSLDISASKYIACSPASIQFINKSTPIDSTYDVTWTFGDGSSAKGQRPNHTYANAGLYDVGLSIVSPSRCSSSQSFSKYIDIKQGPRAGFSFDPKQPSAFDQVVTFKDSSSLANDWIWRFGSFASSRLQQPIITFPDSGAHKVVQIVSHINGCRDTASRLIEIVTPPIIQVPTAFTPNNDELNDYFAVKGYFVGLKNYQIAIYNRYGNLLWESTDTQARWDGTNASGHEAPSDVYVYKLSYLTPKNELKKQFGQFSLIR